MSALEIARTGALGIVGALVADGWASFAISALLILAALMTDWIHEDAS